MSNLRAIELNKRMRFKPLVWNWCGAESPKKDTCYFTIGWQEHGGTNNFSLFGKGCVRRTHVSVYVGWKVSTHFNTLHRHPLCIFQWIFSRRYMGFSFLCFFCQGHVGKIVTNRGKRHSSLWGNWFFKKNEIKAAHLSKYIWQKKIGFWE